MNRHFLAGVVIGFLICYMWKQERITSQISFPTE